MSQLDDNNTRIANDVLQAVGGRQNIASLIHCATRLRFTLIDEGKANTQECKSINGVITVVQKGGMYQVVIGNNVSDVFKEINAIAGLGEISNEQAPKAQQEGNFFKRGLNNFIQAVSGSIMSVVWVMMAGGIIKGVSAIIGMTPWLATYVVGIDETTGLEITAHIHQSGADTVLVLNAMGDAVLFFLPILLGYACGKRFGGSPFLCATIGAILVYPSILLAAGAIGGNPIYLYGIKIPLMNYSSSVLPILVASYFSCVLEKWLMKRIPDVCKKFVVPGICILVVGSLTIMVVGPIMTAVANGVGDGYAWLSKTKVGAVFTSAIFGGLWQVLVVFGMHLAFVPIMILNITINGIDTLGVYAGIATMAQTGAAFGLFLKMRNKEVKATTLGQVVSGIFGITEPIIYATNLPRRKPFYYGIVGAVAGSVVSAIIGGAIYTIGAVGAFGIPSFISPDGIGVGLYGAMTGIVVGFFLPMVLCLLFWKDDTMKKGSDSTSGVVGANQSV